MVRLKLLALSIYAILLVGVYGSEFLLQIVDSFNQRDRDLDRFQRLQKRCYRCLSCGYLRREIYNQDDEETNSKSGLVNRLLHNPYLTIEELPNSEIQMLKNPLEENEKNVNSDQNSVCIACYRLFEKKYLNEYVHTNRTEPHYSTCYECELDSGDMWRGNRCAYCRQPSKKGLSKFLLGLLDEANGVQTRIFDGSVLGLWISTFAMSIISTKLTMYDLMKPLGENENMSGEGVQIFSWKALEMLHRDTWWYYFLVSTYFLHQTRSSFSILINTRGALYMLLPLTTGYIANIDPDFASYLSMFSVSLFAADIYFGKNNWIVSKRFGQVMHRWPQVQFMRTQIIAEPKGWSKICQTVGYNVLYWNWMGSLATAYDSVVWQKYGSTISTMTNWFVHDACVISTQDLMERCGTPQGETAGKVFAILNTFIVSLVSLGIMVRDFRNRKAVFNFKQAGFFLFATFALRHSTELQNIFVAINFGGMAAILVIGLIVLCMACANR